MIGAALFRLDRLPAAARFAVAHGGALLLALLFLAAHVPLPWMMGGLVAGGVLALGGVRHVTHIAGRRTGQLIVGAAIGLYFTPVAAAETLSHLGAMLAAAVATLTLACGLGWLLARSTGLDAATAFFASVPGSPVEMAVMAEKQGGDPLPVALSQILRIVLLVIFVPPTLVWSGVSGTDLTAIAQHEFHWLGLPLLLGLAAIVALAAERLKISNPWFLGPILASGTLTVLELEPTGVPRALLSVAQILLGVSLGAMLQREFLARSRRFLRGALIGTVLLIAGCIALADLVSAATKIGFSTLVLALAPGGIPEMCITANVLHLGVPVVASFHLARIFLLVLVTPWVFEGSRALRRRLGDAPAPGD